MAPVAAHRICRHSATKAAHLPSLSGSDKRRHMNRSEIPLFGGVSRRVSFPFNLGALTQSQDRLGHMLGRPMRCQSFSIAHRIIDHNPALSRDCVGGICDHHGVARRNTQFWGSRVPGIGIRQPCPTLPKHWATIAQVCPIIGQRLPNIWATVAQWLGKVGQRLPRALGGWVFSNAIRRNFGSSASNAPGFW